MQTVGAYIIAKNEEAMVGNCLSSLKGIDEIVFADTGSTDKTIEIANAHDVKLFTDYTWEDHFSKARNHALTKCTKDWILRIDCDETLEPGGLDKIRRLIETTEHSVIDVTMSYPPHSHYEPRLFRNTPAHFYIGASHEYLSVPGQMMSDIVLFAGVSPNHKKDPLQATRILKKELDKNPNLVREKFYYARELYLHGDYCNAILWFDKYLPVSTWIWEKAEAYYFKALSLWKAYEGERARRSILQAILVNPDMKKAWELMAEMNYEPKRSVWKKHAEIATNENVIFK